jgi:hypothetical protein
MVQITLTGHTQSRSGLTLAEYSEHKKLPIDELRGYGLNEFTYPDRRRVIRIPYFDAEGKEASVRFRLAIGKEDGIDHRFRWKRGCRVLPYGMWKLSEAKKAGYIVVVEGESDCHTLWHHKIPVLGIPGADTWRDEWATYLEAIPDVYLVVEPDKAGESLRDRLMQSDLRENLQLLDFGKRKDPSGLYLADPDGFPEAWKEILSKAARSTDTQQLRIDEARKDAWEQCKDLATRPRILNEFVRAMHAAGAVGEERAAKITYLCVTSRLFPRPVSAAVKGPSAAGKSYTTEQVLRFFPTEAYFFLTSMSDKALVYLDEPLSRRILVVAEAVGLQSEIFDYMVRSLLSEGRIRYATVEKQEKTGEHKTRIVEFEGPTGLLVTTTAVELHNENETRMLSLPVDDSQSQTQRILASIGEKACNSLPFGTNDPRDVEIWHALQTWIRSQPAAVVVPYARELTRRIAGKAVRLRRDVAALMVLIGAHALLHQASRKRDRHGRIIATLTDYGVVRDLLNPLLSEGVGATVSLTVRETVEAVKHVLDKKPTGDHVTTKEVADALRLDHSAAWRRIKTAEARGYLDNQETRKGRPAKLHLGDPLPDEQEILPAPREIDPRRRRPTIAGLQRSSGVHQHPSSRTGSVLQ